MSEIIRRNKITVTMEKIGSRYIVTDVAKTSDEGKKTKGKWIKNSSPDSSLFSTRWYCSECGEWQTYGTTKFCMNCGADMRGGETDDKE